MPPAAPGPEVRAEPAPGVPDLPVILQVLCLRLEVIRQALRKTVHMWMRGMAPRLFILRFLQGLLVAWG